MGLFSFMSCPHEPSQTHCCCPEPRAPGFGLLQSWMGLHGDCSVAVVERGPLRGREQEWNISRKELLELVWAHMLLQQLYLHTGH